MSAFAAACLALLARVEPAPSAARAQEAGAQASEPKKAERFTIPHEERRSGKKYGMYAEMHAASPDPSTPLVLLLHQARSSRGEYRPIAPRLRALGYNALALDLCAGAEAREVKNQTAKAAREQGLNPTYLDALVDVEDALLWAREHRAHGPLIVWGSSFSASLALHLAATKPDLVDGVLAFSPGEYFGSLGKGPTWVRDSAQGVECPVLVAASQAEQQEWQPIFEALATKSKRSFAPDAGHGSSMLWSGSPTEAAGWTAVEAFLSEHFPVPARAPEPAAPK